jgi:hemin uptake protein HemP
MNTTDSTDKPEGCGASEVAAALSQAASARTINSVDLLHGAREVLIQHEEKIYRLQVTRNGKLILVK